MQNWQKYVYLYTVMLSLVFCLLGCGSNDVKKAQEFMDAGMYAQAMEVLSKRIGEKPSDPDAHFLMGICNIHTNNNRVANDRFASAVRLKPGGGRGDVLKYSNNSIVQMTTCFFRYLLSSFYCVAHRSKCHVKSF